jgi:hypothetical protein
VAKTGVRGLGGNISGEGGRSGKVIDDLYRQIGQLKVENEWLKKI